MAFCAKGLINNFLQNIINFFEKFGQKKTLEKYKTFFDVLLKLQVMFHNFRVILIFNESSDIPKGWQFYSTLLWLNLIE